MRLRLAMIGLLALVPIAAGTGWWLMPEPRITEANCERILDGMTLAEVEIVLGTYVPDHPYDGDFQGQEDQFGSAPPKAHVFRTWEQSGAMIVVIFADGRVSGAVFRRFTRWEQFDDWYHGVKGWGRAKRLEQAA